MSDASQKNPFMEHILEELIREEKRGRKFFNEASKFVEDKQIKKLFERLTADENQHVEYLEILQAGLRKAPSVRERQVDYDGGTVSLIDLSDMSIGYKDLPHLDLFKADEFSKLLEAVSIEEILKFAMKIEYDNAKYLQKCMEAAPMKHQKDLLKKLILEEKNHFIALQRLCKTCKPEKD